MLKLTDEIIRNLEPTIKPYKIFDGYGLYIFVQPNGSKRWQLKYRFEGREKKLSFGIYPFVSLDEARHMRHTAKKILYGNEDPAFEFKRQHRKPLYKKIAF